MLGVIVDAREREVLRSPRRTVSSRALADYRILEVVDYIVRDYAIERKSPRDFVRSL